MEVSDTATNKGGFWGHLKCD